MEKVIIVGGRDTTLMRLALALAKLSSEEVSHLKIILKEEYGIAPSTLRKDVGLPIERSFERFPEILPKASALEVKKRKKSDDKPYVPKVIGKVNTRKKGGR